MLAALLAAAPSFAANEEEEEKPGVAPSDAKRKFAEGNDHYSRGEYDLAIESFKAAIAADPKLPGPYRNLGLAYRALNRCTDALPMYEKYLELRPESKFTDRVRREIDLCRAKLGQAPLPQRNPTTSGNLPHAPEAQAFLHVGANLIGGEATDEASVAVDGISRGPTPLTIPVTSGVHKIHLERPGFESADATVEIGPGERREVELTMNKLPEKPPIVIAPVDNTPQQPKGSYRKYAWIVMGAAVALGAMGAGFGIAESQLHADVVTADRTMTTRDSADKTRDQAANFAIGAYVGLALGGAALIASTVLFLIDPSRGETHAKQSYVLAPIIAPNGGGLAAEVRF
ncbi:MAG TPA: tetratricopeptide repeat protein [Polyangia bacterium]|nr:tetratricopeptide repeat protein [Polyangia bacterium]